MEELARDDEEAENKLIEGMNEILRSLSAGKYVNQENLIMKLFGLMKRLI